MVSKNKIISRFLTISFFCLASVFASANNKPGYTVLPNGVYFQTQQGPLRVEFVSSDIVRVRYTKEMAFLDNSTIVCIERSRRKVPFSLNHAGNSLQLLSDKLLVQVDLRNHSITYKDAENGRLLLAERSVTPREGKSVFTEEVIYDTNSKRVVKTADGEKEIMDELRRDTIGYTWRYRNHFQWSDGEAIYGLGSHMEDYMNLRGKEMYLCQHNLKAMIPVLNSTAGYGLLFDAGCGMIYKDKDGESFIELEASKQIDYYFMKGNSMDEVIGKYRFLTGEVPMMPRYAFGYIQSKERYRSSKELIDVVAEYRRREVPLDVIVQDWNYWPQGWGYMKMDPRYYPNTANLADSIHRLNAKLMISIWPNPRNNPQFDDFLKKGFMVGNSSSYYDAFNPLARKLYWDYADNEFFSNGFDAWWTDCSEPHDSDWYNMYKGYGWNSHKERWERQLKGLGDLLGAENSCLYSIYHAKGIYENQRLTTDQKRVVNLTRSCYAGQQRYSTITWNGDTHASWKSFAQQIPSGLNFMATGCPYWTIDIGAFFVSKKDQWFRCGDYNDGVKDMGYRELYTRMLQYAAFLPIFRSHGTDTPREIWNFGEPGEPFYESILKAIQLRYRLMPYIYSLAGKVTNEHYTMTRALAFDFPDDANVYDIKDEFMFGPAFLVCPVTAPMYYEKGSVALEGVEKKRNVYLPDGADWIDFWTGQKYKGGQTVGTNAPIDKIPLFVRQGAIVPMCPVAVQHTGELARKEIEIAVYPGKDAEFIWYEDEGDNYNYEKGAFSTIKLTWSDKKKTFSLGKRNGEFTGMENERRIRVVVYNNGIRQEKMIRYCGKGINCKF